MKKVKEVCKEIITKLPGRLKNKYVITAAAMYIYAIIEPKFGLPEWASVSTLVLGFLYNLFGIANNPDSTDTF